MSEAARKRKKIAGPIQGKRRRLGRAFRNRPAIFEANLGVRRES